MLSRRENSARCMCLDTNMGLYVVYLMRQIYGIYVHIDFSTRQSKKSQEKKTLSLKAATANFLAQW